MGSAQSAHLVSIELSPKEVALLKANTQFSEKGKYISALSKYILLLLLYRNPNGFLKDCPGGRLDKEKFVELYQQLYPRGQADNYSKHAFSTFDINHDGSIDFQEFLLAISASSRGNIDERLAATFDVFDISNDGLIDKKELTKVLSAMYDLVGEIDRTGDRDSKTRTANIIAKLDMCGDKKLSKAEFVAGGRLDKEKFVDIYREFYPSDEPDNYCKYAFTIFDTNHDGLVDFSEFLLEMTATSQGDLDDRLIVSFEMYDISKDELIDLKELTTLLTAMVHFVLNPAVQRNFVFLFFLRYDLVGVTDRTGDRASKNCAANILAKLDVSDEKTEHS
ncbi:unnamed protein product [Rotaria socialis]|uniref:EF-hand domain-containing protein n=2 Tax=Rotaria socialis TaxID=392032 RepID=A0A820BBE7_9BILA|nr:unnamed protein product [Rotaria socialis]